MMTGLNKEMFSADRVAYFNPLLPMAGIWSVFIAYSIVASELSPLVHVLLSAFGFAIGWLLYPVLIVFGSSAVSAPSIVRIIVAIALVVFLISAIPQPFISGWGVIVLQMIALAALLAIDISAWYAVLQSCRRATEVGRSSMLKGVFALLFLPFFGVVHVHRVWWICIESSGEPRIDITL